MLNSGNDRVPPSNSMWPLFCNEVGLSYDQEERVRNFQRTMLQEATTWLDRHTARASGLAMQSFHDSLNAVAFQQRQRERDSLNVLNAQQKLKFMAWAENNGDRIKAKFEKKRQEARKQKDTEKYKLSSSHHVAANLYILNDRLQKLVSSNHGLTTITAAALKRLSRRPSFESLGQQKEDGVHTLSRDGSFASSGSLKRISSSLSMDDPDKPPPQQVSPEDGQEAAKATVEKELGFIKEIIPAPVAPVPPPAPAAAMPLPTAAPTYRYSHQTPESPITTSHPQGHPSQHLTPIAAHPPPGAHHAQQYAVPHQSYAPPQYQHHEHYQHHQSYTHQPPSHNQGHYHYHQEQYQQYQHHQQVQTQAQPPAEEQSRQQTSSHIRKSSFLPAHLNVVPEEMFPSTDGAEDFFMSLMDDEDWAIGEGIDMDTAT